MSVYFGYSQKVVRREKSSLILMYQLEYPTTSLNTSMYSVRGSSGGYRYMSMNEFTENTNITLLTHTFSSGTGLDMLEAVVKYSIEVIDFAGNFEYYDIEIIDLKKLKNLRSGSKYNIFPLDKKYNITKIMNKTIISDYVMFSVYFTQLSGTLSGDTSTLDLYIETT